MRRKLAHRHPEDRLYAPLRLRRELFEALFAYAIYVTGRRRRRRGVTPIDILKVADAGELWCKAGQQKVLERYQEHAAYLELEHPMSPRTLTRHVALAKRLKLVNVGNYSRFDARAGGWVQERNVYTITRAGVLWIKRHARALKIPSVV